jgi:hypothetical protein
MSSNARRVIVTVPFPSSNAVTRSLGRRTINQSKTMKNEVQSAKTTTVK